jgi:hypothetical protein
MFEVIAGVLGLPCWGVKRGQGSSLTLELGQPRLLVREPIIARASASPKVRRSLARRHVYVAGEWFLWIYTCDWVVTVDENCVGDSSSARRVEAAARVLDGQQLVGVSLKPRGARTRFIFDLGACLDTKPYNRTSEQWILHTPDERALIFRGDRHYAVVAVDDPEAQPIWRTA